MLEELERYYSLKCEKDKIEAELEGLRRKILDTFQGPIKTNLGAYSLEIRHTERRKYDDDHVWEVLPNKSLWRRISTVQVERLKAAIRVGVLDEELLEDTYLTLVTPSVLVRKL